MNLITAQTDVFAVIGDPVRHSLSPVMMNGWIADHGLDAVYIALALKADDPVAALRALRGMGLRGANVTVPHKEAAARAADRSEAPVANVLRWEADGTVSAFNTDGVGFLGALTEFAPRWRERVSNVLIVGAGGGAQGVARALEGSADLAIANRTAARAEALASSLQRARAADWDALPEQFASADLIVQTTTLGLAASPSPDWPFAAAKPGAIAVDIVYRPLETPFLAAARAHGLTGVDGLGMLIHQGAAAFELWFGVRPDVNSARRRLLAALA